MVRVIIWLLTFGVFVHSEALAAQKRFIVKFKNSPFALKNAVSSRGDIRPPVRKVLEVDESEAADMVEKYRSRIDVEYVEEDVLLQRFSTSDPYSNSQWHFFGSNGISLDQALTEVNSLSITNVAVVDTGITYHSDLAANVLPGADLISDPAIANDGGGRDTDATDAGDYVNSGDECYRGFFEASSWHGTHVAGTIAAISNNGVGVAGINPKAKIVPVRVLGKCGGYISDIADGIIWAAGGSVSGLPINSNPAKVINLSLGGTGACSITMQNAIDYAVSKGAVVVVAAGNSGISLDYNSVTPANCEHVVTVAATNRSGDRASYSNYGNRIDLSAPGGDTGDSVMSTHNSGSSSSGGESYKGMNGTSMATPHVAGVASLILSASPGLNPFQVRDILKDTAAGFERYSSCNSSVCGSGVLDAFEAVRLAKVTDPEEFSFSSNLTPPDSGATHFTHQSDGGGCGSVSIKDKDHGGHYFRSLLLGMILLVSIRKTIHLIS